MPLVVTPCLLAELKAIGEPVREAYQLAKRSCALRICKHHPELSPNECYRSVIGTDNRLRFCVASQDLELRAKLREVPGVPLIYTNKSVVILEPPSAKTAQTVQSLERRKLLPEDFERVKELADAKAAEEEAAKKPAKKRKSAGPNPLSCKRKQKPKVAEVGMASAKTASAKEEQW